MARKTLRKPHKKGPATEPDPRRILRQAGVWHKGLPSVTKMREEIQDMMDVLQGRAECPIDEGILTLMSYADGCFARASEMTLLIQRREADGDVSKGDAYYKFRTGELRTFLELSKRAADLGSRRLTKAQLEFEQSTSGRESRGRLIS